MSDLISRSALIEALKNEPKYSIELPAYMGDSIQKLLNVHQKMIVDVVMKQPTAYNVEKVVAELEEEYNKWCDIYNHSENDLYADGRSDGVWDAINMIRR